MSRWNDRLDRIGQAVDRGFAEPIRITPMAGGDYATGPDPDRTVFEIEAVYVPSKTLGLYGGDGHNLSGNRFTSVIAPMDGEIQILPALLSGKPVVRKNDRVELIESGQAFKVNLVDAHRPGYVILKIGAVQP